MNKKIVLCIGDSLGMARTELPFISTWYYLMANKFPDYFFVNNFRRALTTKELLKKDALENFAPNIVIVQIGIVDCAPRYFKANSLFPKIINRFPQLIKNTFWKYFKKNNQRKNKFADVSPNNFRLNLINYFERCKRTNIEKAIVILIQKPGNEMIKKNPTILKNIQLYNSIILEIIENYTFIEVANPLCDTKDSDYISDGYHLSIEGALKVFEELKKIF